MNDWFDRLAANLSAECGSEIPSIETVLVLGPDEASALLDIARDAAHTSGARQYAPLATYLAGRLLQASGAATAAERRRLLDAFGRAVLAAGPAGQSTST